VIKKANASDTQNTIARNRNWMKQSSGSQPPVRQIYYNFISQLQNARCWRLVHWLKK